MKSKLIGLFIMISLIGFGQSVPNTTTFTLQNVVDAVNPTTDDLQDCFNDAISTYFNPTYSGSKNSLLNFRDYGIHNAECSGPADVTGLNFQGGNGSTTIPVTTIVLSDCPITQRRIYYNKTRFANETDSYFAQSNTAGTIASTVTGLETNTGYYFSVYAYNEFGKDSLVSNFKQFTTP